MRVIIKSDTSVLSTSPPALQSRSRIHRVSSPEIPSPRRLALRSWLRHLLVPGLIAFLPRAVRGWSHLYLKKNSRGNHGAVTQHECMLHTGRLAAVALLASGGIILHLLACILYNNWWPMLTVLMYLILTMPVILFLGADSPSMLSNESDGWLSFTKFLTGASVVGAIAIPSILKHAGIIGWGALTMELSSFGVFGLAILWYVHLNREDEYSSVF